MSIPKVAVLATGLAVALMAATIHPLPAQAFPSKNANCANCHAVGGATTALPSTLTPAPGATYTVAITLAANPAGGMSGYAIIPVTAGTGTINGGNSSAALTYSATMTAPAAAGTYVYNVYTNQGGTDPSGYASGTQYTITVAAAPVVVTTTTALAVSPASPVVAPASPTLTATVSGAGAAGTVEFFNGTTSLGAASAISAGVASKTLTGVVAGSYSYKAVFTPTDAAAFTSSTSAVVAYLVTAAPPVVVTTTTALAVTPASPVVAPASPTLTATVSGAGAAGTVEFFNGTTSLGAPSAISAGVASKTLTGVVAGSYSYKAVFTPTDATAFTSSTSAVSAYLVTAPVPAPTAGFTASAISGVAPLAVTFTDTSTGAPTSWLWTFGNGSSSNVQNPPVVSYTAAGTYTVTLIASNAGGASAAVSKVITVTAPQVVVPVSSFTSSVASGIAPLTVAMTDTSTGTPTAWAWTFGNGTTSTLKSPSVTYTAAGTYTVTLIVSNAGGAGNTASKVITVTAPPVAVPVVSFTASATSGIAPLTVNLSGSATNSPTSWAWNLGDGTTSTVQNPSVTYTVVGTYTVTLIASNAGGASAPVTKTITVTVTDPTTSDAEILWMSRDHGAVGDYVLIKGSGFGTSGAVNFGTVQATVSYWSAQWIVVKVPAGNVDGTSVGVTVTPSGGTASNAVSFRLVSDDGDDDDVDDSSQSRYSVRLGGDLD